MCQIIISVSEDGFLMVVEKKEGCEDKVCLTLDTCRVSNHAISDVVTTTVRHLVDNLRTKAGVEHPPGLSDNVTFPGPYSG